VHPAATLLTRPERLRDAAADLRRHAAQLGDVRADLARRCTPDALAGQWEGRVAERFLVHVDGRHRLLHLDMAQDRLELLASALERAADANQSQIARHRRYRDDIHAELARRQQPAAAAGVLPESLRDTSWPRWHRWITGA
jgi:uncharacterized protein YukE